MAERRTGRRATRPGAPGADPTPQRAVGGGADAPVRASEDTDRAWGGRDEPGGNDDRLRRDKPPHWG